MENTLADQNNLELKKFITGWLDGAAATYTQDGATYWVGGRLDYKDNNATLPFLART